MVLSSVFQAGGVGFFFLSLIFLWKIPSPSSFFGGVQGGEAVAKPPDEPREARRRVFLFLKSVIFS